MTSPIPKISVMMPAFNAGAFISQAIESVQSQTFQDWELICYDDGSKDNTAEIVKSYADHDRRIKLIQGVHGGRGKARNAALAHCRGTYVAMCDADDVSFPDRFSMQVGYLERNEEIAAVGAFQIPFSGKAPAGEVQVITWPVESELIAASFDAYRMGMPNCVAMVRRSCFDRFGGFDEKLLRCQDFGLFLKLHFAGQRFHNLPTPLVYYRQEGVFPSYSYWSENERFLVLAIQRAAASVDSRAKPPRSGVKGRFLRLRYAYFFLKRRWELKHV